MVSVFADRLINRARLGNYEIVSFFPCTEECYVKTALFHTTMTRFLCLYYIIHGEKWILVNIYSNERYPSIISRYRDAVFKKTFLIYKILPRNNI